MKQSEFDEIKQAAENLGSAMYEFDNILRQSGDRIYDQWKAGGKQVSNEFVSMYPCVDEVVEKLEAQVEPDDDDEDGSDDICTCGEQDCNRPMGHEVHETYDFENPLNSIG